ncbi:DUF4402 domain-containing protein [Novosphingobium piscinae]|uniref:DUF4402 domain-containing protein n=1 Tax=Novosphingobium piscinae TaxID=1507448 RepID=A0A7X1KPF7_9SPHN|nr:DUF4402 domain-containing protein [Novosphingobium piscinae]MBC2668637.1 DUF4402 domain-containing protein [Novosphingobium piscinae]
MSTFLRLGIAPLGLLLLASPALAATGNTATATGTANATVIAPLQIIHAPGAAINFGAFTAGTGGTVSVSQAGTASVTGDVGLVTGGTVTADAFTVLGSGSRTFTIATSTGNTVRTSGPTPATMALALSVPATGTLSAAGSFALRVGGTLTVAAGQAAGAYTGSYTVTVTYQ